MTRRHNDRLAAMHGERDTSKDGCGQPLVDDGLYYVQDARGLVGNCASWWCANGQGYTCDLDRAGVYSGREARTMRETDIPWPLDHVAHRVIRHVRDDGPHLADINEGLTPAPAPGQLEALARELYEAKGVRVLPRPDALDNFWTVLALAAWDRGARPSPTEACR